MNWMPLSTINQIYAKERTIGLQGNKTDDKLPRKPLVYVSFVGPEQNVGRKITMEKDSTKDGSKTKLYLRCRLTSDAGFTTCKQTKELIGKLNAKLAK